MYSYPNRQDFGKIVVICGGVGAAKFLAGLKMVVDESQITAVVNTGDDVSHCGLHISPDIDTIIYTLSGHINRKTGWGLGRETWGAMESLKKLENGTNALQSHDQLRYGWFNLGDKDLGTHMFRTARLNEGTPISQITMEIAKSYGAGVEILPMSDDPVRTRVVLENENVENKTKTEISFQEYFVKLHHDVAIKELHFAGADNATPAPGVLEALESADKILIAPSNPLLSIAPILSIQEIDKKIRHRRKDTAFVSPIVAGKALKGPAARVLSELGHIPDASGVARFYSDYADTAIIDTQDELLAPEIETHGQKCLVTNTIMSNPKKSAKLAQEILEFMS